MRLTADRNGKNCKEELRKRTSFIDCFHKVHGFSSYEQILQEQKGGIDIGEANGIKEDSGFSIDLMSRNEGNKIYIIV